MLSLFPSLLYLAPLSTTMLRMAAGLALLYMAYRYTYERKEIDRARFWPIGHVPQWLTFLGSFVVFVTGLFVLIGLYTQAAAMVGMIIALKNVVFVRYYPKLMPLSAIAAALLFVICLSLLFSGAGAFAFDLPI